MSDQRLGSVYARIIRSGGRGLGNALPPELIGDILEYLGVDVSGNMRWLSAPAAIPVPYNNGAIAWRHPALEPPKHGVCKFMKLPAELRRVIFAYELTEKDVVYEPKCSVHSNIAEKDTDGDVKMSDAGADKKKPPPKHNRASDLMILNKVICAEVATVLYEERKFVVHIHEGLKFGGVEFINSGRQKLQYQDDICNDRRFEKFVSGENFGFDRLKKLRFVIFPAATREPQTRHTQVNTFFMVQALCQLLQRSEEKNKLTELTIEFAPILKSNNDSATGRRAIAASESYLWDALRKTPTVSSVHGLTDVEVILRPFSMLRCHRVAINLPHQLQSHPTTQDFISRLQQKMLSSTETVGAEDEEFMEDRWGAHIQALSNDLQRHVVELLYSTGKGIDVPDLDDREVWAEEGGRTKHDLSPSKQSPPKRRRSGEPRDSLWDDDNDDDDGDDSDFDMTELFFADTPRARRARQKQASIHASLSNGDGYYPAYAAQRSPQSEGAGASTFGVGRRLGGGARPTVGLHIQRRNIPGTLRDSEDMPVHSPVASPMAAFSYPGSRIDRTHANPERLDAGRSSSGRSTPEASVMDAMLGTPAPAGFSTATSYLGTPRYVAGQASEASLIQRSGASYVMRRTHTPTNPHPIWAQFAQGSAGASTTRTFAQVAAATMDVDLEDDEDWEDNLRDAAEHM